MTYNQVMNKISGMINEVTEMSDHQEVVPCQDENDCVCNTFLHAKTALENILTEYTERFHANIDRIIALYNFDDEEYVKELKSRLVTLLMDVDDKIDDQLIDWYIKMYHNIFGAPKHKLYIGTFVEVEEAHRHWSYIVAASRHGVYSKAIELSEIIIKNNIVLGIMADDTDIISLVASEETLDAIKDYFARLLDQDLGYKGEVDLTCEIMGTKEKFEIDNLYKVSGSFKQMHDMMHNLTMKLKQDPILIDTLNNTKVA